MEEAASWKGHSFTLLIFGGIVVLCSIFFVLGMLVGRTQGQRIAEMAFAEETSHKPQAQTAGDNLQLDFYSETTDEKPDLKLQPASAPPPAPVPAASPARPTTSPRPPAAAAKPAAKKETPETKESYLQIFATMNVKQADSQLKRVQSKGFKAKRVSYEQNKVVWYRVYVGPYKDSEVNLAKSDLKAKGFKDVIVR